jgi:hypothetical protein
MEFDARMRKRGSTAKPEIFRLFRVLKSRLFQGLSVKQPGIWAQKIIADNDAAMNDAKSKCL